MKRLYGHKFELKKGDLICIRKKKVDFEGFCKDYIGELRDYDGVKSKSGCCLKGFSWFRMSGIINKIDSHLVFAWYKKGFIVLSKIMGFDFEACGSLEDYEKRYVKLYKLNKKEAKDFKELIVKNDILKGLEK